jgi:hypothetical protein
LTLATLLPSCSHPKDSRGASLEFPLLETASDGPLGALAAGGTLEMTVKAKTDGTEELNGTVTNVVGIPLNFGPGPLSIALDTNGFPVDVAWATTAPFTLTGPTATGGGTTTTHHVLH